jgi:O-antigen ligase
MMGTRIFTPGDWGLVAAVCLAQLALLVLPIPAIGPSGVALISLTLVSVLVVTSNVHRSILFLIFISTVIPGYISEEHLRLPMDFKFAEGLFMAVIFFALLSALKDRVSLPITPLNRPITLFLLIVVGSCAIGLYLGHSVSQLLRDVRYPLYYGLFYIVTIFFDRRRHPQYLYMLIVIASIVGIEYLIEFLSELNLSIAGAFHRVARTEGLLLPIGTLLIAAAWLYAPGRNVRLILGIALVPAALALVLTVGRGMWISAGGGFVALLFLFIRDRQRLGLRRLWIILAVPLLVFTFGSVFETATDTGVGAAASRRLASAETIEEDRSLATRLISYRAAWAKIVRRPILGGGHGETVTFPIVMTEVPHIATVGAVDNVYLTILLRMGLVGLFAFLWIYVRGLRLSYRLFQTSQTQSVRFFAAGFFVVYSAMLVYGMADSTMIGTRLIFIHAASLGILAQLSADTDDV